MRTPRAGARFLFSSLVGLAAAAYAQPQPNANASRCDSAVVERLGRHFGLANFSEPASGMDSNAENSGLIVAGVCKQWPGSQNRTIAAFAYDGGLDHEKVLLVAVVERPDTRVIASYRGVIPEDAASEISSRSLSLDIARYTLSKRVRAFGVRVNSFRERCAYEGGLDDALRLFVMEGPTIRPVLFETMWHWSYSPGDRCGGQALPRVDARIVIAVEPTASLGFADLRLTATRSDGKKPISHVVKYNGQRYDLAPWTRAFDDWWF